MADLVHPEVMHPRLTAAARNLLDAPLFCTSQARDWGISRHDLATLLRLGRIIRVDRGWYSTRVDADAETLHVLRAVAVLQLHHDSCAAGHTACLVHGLPLARADLSTVEVVRAQGEGGRRQGIRTRASRDEDRVAVRVALADTTVQAVDIPTAVVGTALLNNPVAALVAGDAALHSGRATRGQIDAALRQAAGRTGVEGARQALAHLDGRHESPGETLTHWELRRLGWELVPQWQVRAAGRSYRLDFKVRGYQLAVEFDGAIKDLIDGAAEAQMVRQGHLEQEGWTFARFGWADLDDPGELHRRMTAAARRARRDE